MADFRMQRQLSPPFGAYDDVDMDEIGVGDVKLDVSYSHASRLSFTCVVPQHTFPFSYTDFIRVWDADGSVGGSAQSASNPLFEGYPEEITPGADTNTVKVVCYDPTYRATRRVTVMNAPYQLDPVNINNFPVDGDAAYPRAVFNVTNDNDDDFAYAILLNAPCGQIIAQVLNDAYLPLYHLNAAPGDGSAAGNDLAWNISELGEDPGGGWTSDLDFEPQEKIVSTSESPRSFVERFLAQYQPAFKLFWEPGTRKWRVHDMPNLTAVNVAVNDPASPYGMVLSLDIQRSAEACATAVKFYGPEAVEWREANWVLGGSGNTLIPLSTFQFGNPPNVGTCYHSFQIIDPAFTRMARKGPYPVYVVDGYGLWANASGTFVQQLVTTYVQTWVPTLQVRYEASDGGDAQWRAVGGVWFNFRNGIATVGDACIWRYNSDGVPSEIETPVEAKLVYPAFAEPLTVRYPSSGYEGSAYSVGGLKLEQKEYDEALAVGYSYGLPITTTTRLARFQTLAEHLHRQRKDLVYTGGMVLDGLQYEFARLRRRVNLTAKKDDGSSLTTGWEGIGAWVTDVSYDFEEQTTQLTFSSDQLEIMGEDVAYLKQLLKIRAAQFFQQLHYRTWFTYQQAYSLFGQPYLQQIWGVEVWMESGWFDEFGEIQ